MQKRFIIPALAAALLPVAARAETAAKPAVTFSWPMIVIVVMGVALGMGLGLRKRK